MKVLISGASGGLGGVVACAFMGAGHSIAGIARSWNPEQAAEGFFPIAANLTSREAARGAVQEAREKLGGLDAIVHTVGAFAGGSVVEGTSAGTMREMMEINYYGAFYLLGAALPHFREQGQGRIVAIGARAGVLAPAGLSAYSASKAALTALVKTIAHETKGTGITANLIAPGTMDTPANRGAMPDADPAGWIPTKHVASLALWLCGPESASVTGQEIAVPGTE